MNRIICRRAIARAGIKMFLFPAAILFLTTGCRSGERSANAEVAPPPPDARRPQLRTEAELAEARERLVREGRVVPTATPTVAAERKPTPAKPPQSKPEPMRPSGDSIRTDVLMVNNSTLSVAEVLYPMRNWIEETRSSQTPRGFMKELQRQIRNRIRNEVGTILVYEKAISGLEDQKRQMLDGMIDRAVHERVSQEFGDSDARFERHLQRFGLSMDQFREMEKRRLLVRSYTHEMFAPQVTIRRDELLAYYRDNLPKFSTEETREFMLIELPYEAFLPEGVTWPRATRNAKAQARLKARRQATAAHAALAERSFEDVAREYSRGVHARDGGSWGQIGQPLNPPYEDVSKLIFTFREGQTSKPVKTETGWYIARCGRIEHATRKTFQDVQDEIRTELENERFGRIAGDYIFRLSKRATISNLDAFIDAAVKRAVIGWPAETTAK